MRTCIALLLLVLNGPVLAETGHYGRLFTSPSQRAELNYLRQINKYKSPLQALQPVEEGGEAPIPLSDRVDAVAMQGYVKRSDGKKGTVWINQTALTEGEARDGLAVGQIGNTDRIMIKGDGLNKPLVLKPGQRYLSDQDRVVEESAVERIIVHPAK